MMTAGIIMVAIVLCAMNQKINHPRHSTIARNGDYENIMMTVEKVKCEYCNQQLQIESDDQVFIEKQKKRFTKKHEKCAKSTEIDVKSTKIEAKALQGE